MTALTYIAICTAALAMGVLVIAVVGMSVDQFEAAVRALFVESR